MQYMNIKEASGRWGISERRIRILCSEGRVDGAQRSGWAWNIPVDAPKPGDGRRLRHLKNFDMRVGAQNFSHLDQCRQIFSQSSEGVSIDKLKGGWNRICEALCLCIMEDEAIPASAEQVHRIFTNHIVPELPLSTHLLLLNCRSVLYALLRQTGLGPLYGPAESVETSFWSEQSLKDLHHALLHALDDEGSGIYRNAEIPAGGAWGGDQRIFPVYQQMETLFVQYDREWRMLHPMVRGVFLFGELLRIRPFERHGVAVAWLALAGELLAGGYPPAVLDGGRLPEFKATLALTQRRGNYQGTARMIEESVQRELTSLTRLCQE